MTNAKEILAKLDKLSMSASAPDARRVFSAAATRLRGAVQSQTKIDAIERQMHSHKDRTSNQGAVQYASLAKSRDALPEHPLAAALSAAQSIIELWAGY